LPLGGGWWVGKLLDFHEPPLLESVSNAGVDAYRILRLPSLVVTGDWVIRVEKAASGASVVSKRSVLCKGGSELGIGSDWGREHVTGSVRVDEDTWDAVSSCMQRAFWGAPARDSELEADGTTFVVEGIRGGDYHLISRQDSNDRPDPILECTLSWNV
jgi:hypothetical protein